MSEHHHAHPPAGAAGHAHHGHHGDPSRNAHGNPFDLEQYLARLEDPSRREWQMPEELVAALGLQPGQSVADVGAGPGVMALLLARAVGPTGRVHAVEVDPRIHEVLVQRLAAAGAGNVTPLLGRPEETGLPTGSCDQVLLVNSYHHLEDGPGYLRRLAAVLKPGGSVAVVDFHGGDLPMGPPPEHRLPREKFLEQAEAAGYRLAGEHTFLPYQYFCVLKPV